jgi:hypothetical protein
MDIFAGVRLISLKLLSTSNLRVALALIASRCNKLIYISGYQLGHSTSELLSFVKVFWSSAWRAKKCSPRATPSRSASRATVEKRFSRPMSALGMRTLSTYFDFEFRAQYACSSTYRNQFNSLRAAM